MLHFPKPPPLLPPPPPPPPHLYPGKGPRVSFLLRFIPLANSVTTKDSCISPLIPLADSVELFQFINTHELSRKTVQKTLSSR